MINKLSIIQGQSQWQPEIYYSELAIDGIAFDEWLSNFIDKKPFNPDNIDNVKGLALSLDLFNENEMQLVWYFLGHIQAGDTKIVPLLVCPDDVDLSCIVIVVEQVATETHVIWRRFGRDTKGLDEQSKNYNDDDIDWFGGVPNLMFEKENFIQIFNQLKDEVIAHRQKNGQNISIIFPADHDRIPRLAKEDWELEVESWYE